MFFVCLGGFSRLVSEFSVQARSTSAVTGCNRSARVGEEVNTET